MRQKALECIDVLGPTWLAARPGPCFVRCSSGVNARLVGSKAACAASRRLKFAAFYADCQHEVDTLTGGLRCVLVYNLTGGCGRKRGEDTV